MNICRKISFFAALVLITGFLSCPSAWSKPKEKPAEPPGPPPVIQGYDPVAYFKEGRPVKGKNEFLHTWNDKVWRFSSEENKLKFIEYPERYAPQYEGYSAREVADGQKIEADPKIWSVVQGKLYLHKSLSSQTDWEKAREEMIRQADYQWPRIR